MEASLALTMQPRLEQRLSPELVAFVQSLALSTAELEREVEDALAENPALERVAAIGCRESSELRSGDAVGSLAARSTWREELTMNARLLCSKADARVIEFVVGSLNEHGFLADSLDDIAAAARTGLDDVHRAVEAVRQAGPPGIATRDARESLLAQLDAKESGGRVPALARTLIGSQLDALAGGDLGAVARTLGVSRDEVVAARDFISTELQPWPALAIGAGNHAEPRDTVEPDLVVSERGDVPGRLDVELAESARIRLIVSPFWERALRADQGLSEAERRRVQLEVFRARSFVSRLRRRERTLLAVARCIVDRQRDYVLRGPAFLRPLTRTAIAAELGIHDSTVGRAVAGKYALLPSGRLVALATLFDAAAGVLEQLARIVAAEQRPLSDRELARELEGVGVHVARRTVAKYRARLGIPAQAAR